MRPYRGLTKDGKWVKGWYMEHPFNDAPNEFKSVIVQDEVPHEVLPETVGQSTGLKDKNGKERKEVYDGDIFIINENDDEWYAEVGWDSKRARFEFKSFHSPVTDVSLLDAIKADNCRLVGNIHQNKDWLDE